MEIRPANLDDKDVRDLIQFHHENMLADSPQGMAFVFDVEQLKSNAVNVLEVRKSGLLVGVGAVALRGTAAELKSMRIAPERTRSGIGSQLLSALEVVARKSGAKAISLETGSGPAFESASRFYQKQGFSPCGPFGDYEESTFNHFMTKTL